MALVVEVVQEAGDAPQLLVLAEAPRVGAHGRLDRQDVLAERGRLGPLAEEGPGLRARKLERHGWYPSPAPGPDRRPPGRPLPPLMEKFVIEGGVPLSGTVVPAGNKNAALPLLAACLLTDERGRAPQRAADPRHGGAARPARGPRRDGRAARRQHRRAPRRRASRKTDVDPDLAERIRASFLVAGPLLARFGAALMPPPGGDVIGRRRLDPHLDAFRALGARRRARPRHPPDAPPTAASRPATSSWTSRP